MPDTSRNVRYRDRLARLSASQRSDLARRLALANNSSTHFERDQRLIACVVAKPGRDIDSDDVREHVRQHLAEYMVPQVIVTTDTLPKTAAGKLDRSALPGIELASPQHLTDDQHAAPANDIEKTLAKIWANVLGLDVVSTHDNFFEVGGDSLLSIRILSQANRAGLRISPEKFFAHPTIAEQAKIAEPEGIVTAEQGIVTGKAPLMPIQSWFFENVTKKPQQWNQAPLYAVSEPLQRVTLDRAVQRLLNHHDALRSRFVYENGDLVQSYGPPLSEPPVDWIELNSESTDAQRDEITALANKAHEEFTLATGPLIRFVYFLSNSPSHDYLLIVAHHLIIDAVSWRVLIEDFTALLNSIHFGKPVLLPKKSTSLKEWTIRLAELANTERLKNQTEYWSGLRTDFQLPMSLPGSIDENTVGSVFTVSTVVDATLTNELVNQVPRVFRSQINDLLLAALTIVLSKFAGTETIRFDLEGHGREPLFDDVDLSRTVGWLTTVYPVVLKMERDQMAGSVLKSVRDQLRTIPMNGIGHGLLRYLLGSIKPEDAPRPQVLFNYLGRNDQDGDNSDRLRLLHSNIGQTRAADGRRIYVIEINSRIQDGRLVLDWQASNRLHSRAAIEDLAEGYLEALRSIAAAASSGNTSYAPTDFPLANLDTADMENLTGLLDSIDDDS